jgi:hypothetical protein
MQSQMTDTADEVPEVQECISCRKLKAKTHCRLCMEPICKTCLQHMPPDAFLYLPEIPEDLAHPSYCGFCLDSTVTPALEEYHEILGRAEQLILLTKAYRGHVHVLKKAQFPIEVKDFPDRTEVIMRLAYLAAKEGYNALIQADIVAKKVRNEAYQKSSWSGKAWPAKIDADRLAIEEGREEMYRRGK